MMLHPSRTQLLTYTEGLIDQCATLSASVAAHVADCPRCASEVEGIRTSLEVARSAGSLEPSRELTAKILLAAKSERRVAAARRPSWTVSTVRPAAYAFALALVLTLSYVISGGVTGSPAASAPSGTNATVPKPRRAAVVPLDLLSKPSHQEEVLRQAVMSPHWQPQSQREQAYWRIVSAVDEDISEGLDALQNNPFCVRAGQVVDANRQKRVEALKTILTEKSF